MPVLIPHRLHQILRLEVASLAFEVCDAYHAG